MFRALLHFHSYVYIYTLLLRVKVQRIPMMNICFDFMYRVELYIFSSLGAHFYMSRQLFKYVYFSETCIECARIARKYTVSRLFNRIN